MSTPPTEGAAKTVAPGFKRVNNNYVVHLATGIMILTETGRVTVTKTNMHIPLYRAMQNGTCPTNWVILNDENFWKVATAQKAMICGACAKECDYFAYLDTLGVHGEDSPECRAYFNMFKSDNKCRAIRVDIPKKRSFFLIDGSSLVAVPDLEEKMNKLQQELETRFVKSGGKLLNKKTSNDNVSSLKRSSTTTNGHLPSSPQKSSPKKAQAPPTQKRRFTEREPLELGFVYLENEDEEDNEEDSEDEDEDEVEDEVEDEENEGRSSEHEKTDEEVNVKTKKRKARVHDTEEESKEDDTDGTFAVSSSPQKKAKPTAAITTSQTDDVPDAPPEKKPQPSPEKKPQPRTTEPPTSLMRKGDPEYNAIITEIVESVDEHIEMMNKNSQEDFEDDAFARNPRTRELISGYMTNPAVNTTILPFVLLDSITDDLWDTDEAISDHFRFMLSGEGPKLTVYNEQKIFELSLTVANDIEEGWSVSVCLEKMGSEDDIFTSYDKVDARGLSFAQTCQALVVYRALVYTVTERVSSNLPMPSRADMSSLMCHCFQKMRPEEITATKIVGERLYFHIARWTK